MKEVHSNMELKGQVAVITGSSRGIGRATAHRFAVEGATVEVTSRSKEDLELVVADILNRGGEALAITAHIVARCAYCLTRFSRPMAAWIFWSTTLAPIRWCHSWN